MIREVVAMGAPIVAAVLLGLLVIAAILLAGLTALVLLLVYCERRQVRYPYWGALVGAVIGFAAVLHITGGNLFAASLSISWAATVGGWATMGVVHLSRWTASRLVKPATTDAETIEESNRE
jgi:hypothetical protein